MNVIVSIFIFLVVVFLYIHITDQYKKSEDLEIYEMDFVSNEKLQDVCNVKQPVLFEYKSFASDTFDKITIANLLKNGSQIEVNVKDTNDYWKTPETFDYITFPLQSSLKLMETDSRSHFITDSNSIFVEECGLNPIIHKFDQDLKPPFNVHTNYDILFGSKDTVTPLKYHTHTRYFLGISTGKIQIKMTPWRSTRYLHKISDYDNYEFRSPINVWSPQKEYISEMNKLKFLDFDVMEGHVLYIPPYWWYSIKYINASDTNITTCFACEYSTVVNILSNITDIGKYYLQQQNITKKTTKTVQLNNNTEATPSFADPDEKDVDNTHVENTDVIVPV